MTKLLTRDDFRNGVFKRDNHRCVACGAPAVDAHHILERRLFPDGGYYLKNGASVCGACHLKAESTELSAQKLRELCGIDEIVLPPHLYSDHIYDKWGNIIVTEHPERRLPGELFNDESVQKIIKPVLHLFSKYVKYPRTYHLPWSPGFSDDDRVLTDLSAFEGKRVIITEKMDGENTTFYNDFIHARAIAYTPHVSRDRVKALWASIKHNIPDGWRICGENLFAKHSIHYTDLPTFFMLFSVWNDKNECLSWDETKEYAELLELETVPVLFDGIWDEKQIKELYSPTLNGHECEGYVVRVADSFPYGAFRNVIAKFVRKNHVHTHGHWMNQAVIKNEWK